MISSVANVAKVRRSLEPIATKRFGSLGFRQGSSAKSQLEIREIGVPRFLWRENEVFRFLGAERKLAPMKRDRHLPPTDPTVEPTPADCPWGKLDLGPCGAFGEQCLPPRSAGAVVPPPKARRKARSAPG